MSVPTPVNLNNSLPAPPAGYSNILWQADNNNPRNVSAYAPTPGGGVSIKTASYTAVKADWGLLLVFNGPPGTPITLTLPATPPDPGWRIQVQNINFSIVTIQPNGRGLDGGTTALTLYGNSGCYIATDGTDYYTERGIGQRPIQLVSAWPGKAPASQKVMIYTAANRLYFPANFSGPTSQGSCGANPTATAQYILNYGITQLGTISVSTAGVFTWATTGGSATITEIGTRFELKAPTTQDATLSDVGFTILAIPLS